MSSFTNALITRHSGNEAIVEKEFEFYLDEGFWLLRIPKGASTDLCSFPWWIQWLLPKMGAYDQACAVHDFLYRWGFLIDKTGTAYRTVDRKEADKIFVEAMRVLKVPERDIKIIYAGVRIDGGEAWDWHEQNRRLALADYQMANRRD